MRSDLSTRSLCLVSALAVGMIGGTTVSLPAVAQQIVLDEIVVTARKRSESLQEIPLTITAFSADDIDAAGFQDFGDLAAQTAGLSFETRMAGIRAGRIDSLIRLRGVTGTTSSVSDHLAPTSLFVDGIFMLGNSNVIGFGDLERVEVIKGPQSAFFGRNTFAGAINYVTKNPNLEEAENSITALAGTYKNFDVNASFNGPLIEGKLGYSINVRSYNKGAEWTANDGGQLGEESTRNISAVLYGEPTETSSFKLRVNYQKDDDGPPIAPFVGTQSLIDANTCAGKSYQRGGGTSTPAQNGLAAYWCGMAPNIRSPFGPTFSSETTLRPQIMAKTGRVGFVASPFELLIGPQPNIIKERLLDQQFIPGTPTLDSFGMERYQQRVAFTGDAEILNGHTLTVLAGYNETGLNFLRDYDRDDTPGWYSVDPKYGEDYSAEVRISSPEDQRFRYLAGLTYYDQTFLTSGSGGLLIAACTAPLQSGACETSGPGQFTLPATSGNTAEVMAGYASLSYDITDELTLDVEARYSIDERTTGEAGQFFTVKYKDLTPRVILSYQPTDETNLYGQYSKGILPGATNGLISTCSPNAFSVAYTSPITGQQSTASQCDQLSSQLPGGVAPGATPSQSLNSYEAGWKQVLGDGRFRFNTAAYLYKWKNLPFPLRVSWVRDDENPLLRDGLPNSFANSLSVQVSGSQKIWGMEVESGMAITENWDAQFNVSYQKNEWSRLDTTSAVQQVGFTNADGLSATRYPKWMGNLTSTYTDQINADWDWFVRADVIYHGSYWADTANILRGPEYMLTHARAGFTKDDFRVEFYVKNLFDTETWLGVSQTIDFFYDAGNFNFSGFSGIAINPQQKRQFGLRTRIGF